MKSKQIIKQSIYSIIGKRIEGVSELEDDTDNLCISFTDDTFIVLEAWEKSTGYSNHSPCISIADYELDETNYILVEAGIVSEEVHEAAIKESDRLYKLQHSKLQDNYKRQRLAALKLEYDKLNDELNASEEK